MSKWYFGHFVGLDFMNSPPTSIPASTINVSEGCSSIADANGNLLFYTDGNNVYNQNDLVMQNGIGLLGDPSTSQGAVIVKQPGSSTLYYVFTLGAFATGTLSYSIVDMSLAGGLGGVTTTTNVYLASPCSERMAAVRHCNDKDAWIIVRGSSNVYMSFLLTSTGVNPTPVISAVGTYTASDYIGYTKISPNRRKMVSALYSSGFELYDFDPATGIISNPQLLPDNACGAYGCEFSPDCSKLYGTGFASNQVYQWDLCAGSTAAIAASRDTLFTSNVAGGTKCAVQLGPDGKIYVASSPRINIGVVNNPNGSGSSCNYVDVSQPVGTSTKVCYLGLPNFLVGYRTPPPTFTSVVSLAYGCQTASFTAPPIVTGNTLNCIAPADMVTGVRWNFGDPVSGAANTSTLINPAHTFSGIGTFSIQLVLYYYCHSDTLKQAVTINQSCLTLSQSIISCSAPGSATVNSNFGIGPFSYTWMPTGQTSSVATGLGPGVYTVTVFDQSNNSTFTANAIFTPPVPLTGYINNSDSVHCYGAATGTANVIGLAGGSGAQFYTWTKGSTTYTLPNPTNLTAGTWVVTVTDALTGCTLTGGFFILQPAVPNLVITASSPSMCPGGSISLGANFSGGTPPIISYSWTLGPPTANYTVSLSQPGSYTYSLAGIDSYSCPVTKTITLAVIPNPTLNITSTSICPLQIGTLTASGANSYSWNGATGLNSFTDNPIADTQYTVTGSTAGCSASGVATITLKPLPAPTITTGNPVCQNDNVVLSAAGGTAYLWSGPQSFVSSSQNALLNPVQLNQAGTYQLTVTAANSCTAAISATLVVNPLPTVTITPATSSICINIDTVAFSAGGTAASLNWVIAPGLQIINSQNALAFPLATSVYTVIGSLNGCTVQATATVNVLPLPNLNVSLSSQSICAQALSGSPNTIVLSASGANTYTLSTAGHIYNSNPAGPTSSLSLLPPYQPTGVETATLTGSNGVCTISKTATFVTIPNPTITVSNPTPVICAGQSYTYTSSGASSFTWSSTNPGSTTSTTGSIVVASPSINSVFSVVGDSLGCLSALKVSYLTVDPIPTLTLNPSPAKVCLGSSVALVASGTGTLYSWTPASFLDNDTGAVVHASPPSQKTYTVISSLRTCSFSAVISVSVLPLPTALITPIKTTACPDDLIQLSGSGGIGYFWQAPANVSVVGKDLIVKVFSSSNSGNYTLTVSDENNCKASATQLITVYDPPSGSFDLSDMQACAPFCAGVNFIPSPASASITTVNWQAGGQTFSNNFQYCVNTPGTYPIAGIVTDINGCTASFSTAVNAYPSPKADFTYSPELPVEGFEHVKFNDASENGVKYSWTFGNASHTSLLKNPDFLFGQNGNYPVVLVVNNQWHCSDTVIKIITVIPDFAIYMPNAFTPNDDGLNDFFGPVLRGAKSFKLIIFDRWGGKVFETSDINKGWDGSFAGEPCQENVYVWKLDVTSIAYPGKEAQNVHKSGEVLLYR